MGNSRSKDTVLELDSVKDDCDAVQQTSLTKPYSHFSPSSISFFPKREIPAKIRKMIYNELVLPRNILRIWDHHVPLLRALGIWIIYYQSSTSRALALLRNGAIWENDAAHVSEVKRATEALTFNVDWENINLTHRAFFRPLEDARVHRLECLLALLKAVDLIYSMDLEYEQASGVSRNWTRPIHESVIKYGVYSFWSCLNKTGYVAPIKGRNGGYTPEKFLQTMILKLRYKPEINIRVLIRCNDIVSYADAPLSFEPPQALELKLATIEATIKVFLARLSSGMTVTRLPRKSENWIRHRITLVTGEDEFEGLKNRLGNFRNRVHWEKATNDYFYDLMNGTW